jgi:hypothetical protein
MRGRANSADQRADREEQGDAENTDLERDNLATLCFSPVICTLKVPLPSTLVGVGLWLRLR